MIKKIKAFLFEHRTTRQVVAKNTLWLFAGEGFSRLIKIIIVIYAARILGAEGWGVFSYAITIAGLFTIFSDIGLNAILTREAVKKPELKAQYISTSFLIKLILLLCSSILILVVAPAFTKIEAAQSLLPIVALLLIFDGLREFGFALNRALERMEREATIKIITNLAIVGFSLIALLIRPTPYMLAAGYTLGSAIGFGAIFWTLKHYFYNLLANFSKKLLRPIMAAAWPFALTGVLGGIMINTDTLMLGWFRSAAEVGYYSAAQRPVQFLYTIPSLLGFATFPLITRLVRDGQTNKLRQVLEKTTSLLFLLAIPLSLGGLILGKEIISLLFGNEYLPAVAAFRLLILSIFFIFPAFLLTNTIFAYDQQRVFIGLMIFGASLNILLNLALIPGYGIAGSALATLLAQAAVNISIWRKMKSINYFSVLPHLKRILPASFLMVVLTITLRYLGLYFILNIFVSAIIYLLLLLAFREPLFKEIKLVLKI